MTDERRYGEDEVRAIFEVAAERSDSTSVTAPTQTGLTLPELKQIGREVGIDEARIAEAAVRLDLQRGALEGRRELGMPVGVGRSVDLPRALTDREWEVLLGEIRDTFGARGKAASHGLTREWSNGNLHVFHETTENGHRVRMRTVKGNALAANRMGLAGLGMAALLSAIFFVLGDPAENIGVPIMMAAMGFGALAVNAIRLPSWARTREGQMELLGARALELAQREPEE